MTQVGQKHNSHLGAGTGRRSVKFNPTVSKDRFIVTYRLVVVQFRLVIFARVFVVAPVRAAQVFLNAISSLWK